MTKTQDKAVEREIETMHTEWLERREVRDMEAIQRLKERFDYAINLLCSEGGKK